MHQAGPLAALKPESRTENAKCCECGAEFEQAIYIRPDGSEVPPDTLCPGCRRLAAEVAKEERQQAALAEADEMQRDEWELQCGVEPMFSGKTFDNFTRSLQPKAYDAVSKWEGGSIVLMSPNIYGVGKTHLVSALANKLVSSEKAAGFRKNGSIFRYDCPVRIENESRLLSRIRQTFHSNEGESDEDIYEKLSRPRLLIMDDVGKVRPRDLSFTQSVHYRIIDDRYCREEPFVLTTNLSPDELEAHIGGACADRLREMCGKSGIIVMKGQSYRREK